MTHPHATLWEIESALDGTPYISIEYIEKKLGLYERYNTMSETKDPRRNADDPVLRMLGVGEQLWTDETGDQFIERLRSEELPPPRQESGSEVPPQNVQESVWDRIESHQGQEFKTAKRLPFTYEVEGSGIWFFRNGKRINRKLARTQVDKAVARCPLRTTTEIKDLMDYAYLFGLLTDTRIRSGAW